MQKFVSQQVDVHAQTLILTLFVYIYIYLRLTVFVCTDLNYDHSRTRWLHDLKILLCSYVVYLAVSDVFIL